MIEIILKDFLKNNLDIDVGMEKPENIPDKFVKIERLSHNEDNRVYDCRFAIQSYGGSLYETILLNDEIARLMRKFVMVKNISKVKIVNSYHFPDITYKRERYQLIADIYYMED